MKESEALELLDQDQGLSITHDDKLLLRGQKHELGLTPRDVWHRHTNIIHEHGEPVIVNYCRPPIRPGDEGDYISPDDWERIDNPWEKSLYKPQYLRGLSLPGYVELIIKNNQVDLRLERLFHNLVSRYRAALESIIDLRDRGILDYTPRVDNPTKRNIQEAMRNRLRRNIRPTEYEHNILIRGDLGTMLYRDVRESGKAKHITPGVVYLKGFEKYKGQKSSLKMYDLGARDGTEQGKYWKIETTLYKAYFKSEGIDIRALTEQPDIQELIMDKLVREVASVLRLAGEGTMEAIQRELGIENVKVDRRHTEVARSMLRRDKTLTERVRDLERNQKDIQRRLRALEDKA